MTVRDTLAELEKLGAVGDKKPEPEPETKAVEPATEADAKPDTQEPGPSFSQMAAFCAQAATALELFREDLNSTADRLHKLFVEFGNAFAGAIPLPEFAAEAQEPPKIKIDVPRRSDTILAAPPPPSVPMPVPTSPAELSGSAVAGGAGNDIEAILAGMKADGARVPLFDDDAEDLESDTDVPFVDSGIPDGFGRF